MKIEKITKMKNGKYKIELDNKEKITTFDEVILNNNLLFKKELDNDLINKINIETSYYGIYDKVVKYIMTKIRSEKEINEYLDKQKVNENDKVKIIDTLKKNKLINDLNFTVAYISDRFRLSNDGPYKIKNELLNHNIDINIIDNELSKYSEEEIYDKLNHLILKKIKTIHKSKYIIKQKINEYFINLGYSRDMINSILNNIDLDSEDSILKDYKALYNKLSKKYDGDKLEFEIKQRLYRKGYNSEEINTIKREF